MNDFLTSVVNECFQEPEVADNMLLNNTMESYLGDLNDLSAVCESIDMNSVKVRVIQAIKKFVHNTNLRISRLIGAIIDRLDEFVDSLKNRVHTKKINAPDVMVSAYAKMSSIVNHMTDDASNLVLNFGKICTSPTLDVNDIKEKNAKSAKEIKDAFKLFTENDVIGDQSIRQFLDNVDESHGRRKTVIPAVEQKNIDKMRRTWKMLKTKTNVQFQMVTAFIVDVEKKAKIAHDEKRIDDITRTKIVIVGVYNSVITRITGALKMISYLQKYISGFIIVAKEYKEPTHVDYIQNFAAIAEH